MSGKKNRIYIDGCGFEVEVRILVYDGDCFFLMRGS